MAEHDLHAVAFPKLDEAQMAALGRCPLTKLKRYRDGEKLFEVGDRDFKFFVVKSGEVEIRGRVRAMTPKTVAVHRARAVHRRRGAADRQPGARQRRRPGRLRGLRGLARRPAASS